LESLLLFVHVHPIASIFESPYVPSFIQKSQSSWERSLWKVKSVFFKRNTYFGHSMRLFSPFTF